MLDLGPTFLSVTDFELDLLINDQYLSCGFSPLKAFLSFPNSRVFTFGETLAVFCVDILLRPVFNLLLIWLYLVSGRLYV